jgi:MerR family transcriptional regulator/heat shock protein HspR
MTNPYEISDDTPVYVISVAAELSGMHPQTLRSYDRLGLVSPGRSAGRGRGRRYSLRDVLVLREVQRLSQAGVSLPGIKRIMELEGELDQYRAALAEMAAEMAQLRTELESTRAVAARLAGLLRSRGTGGTLVPVRDGRTGGPVTGPAAAAPEPTPAARESTPAARESTPAARESTPAARESTPAAREPGPDLPAAGTAGDPPPEAG